MRTYAAGNRGKRSGFKGVGRAVRTCAGVGAYGPGLRPLAQAASIAVLVLVAHQAQEAHPLLLGHRMEPGALGGACRVD